MSNNNVSDEETKKKLLNSRKHAETGSMTAAMNLKLQQTRLARRICTKDNVLLISDNLTNSENTINSQSTFAGSHFFQMYVYRKI